MSFDLISATLDSQVLIEGIAFGEALWRYFTTAFGAYLVLFGLVNIRRVLRGSPLWGDLDAVIAAMKQVRPFLAFVVAAMPAAYRSWKRERGVA